ncbi:MAG TPA: carboxylating nicotinate-nucleotide diphosphorylase [Gemmatimonadales bacterium]|nr:carboxylating nicotinate-nucleotide diphosphorylase [Gemmatimonadales bacterium]
MGERAADPADPQRVAAVALAEDGDRDITTDCLLDQARSGAASMEVREPVVLAGRRYADAVARECGLKPEWNAADGDAVDAGADLGRLTGDLRAILRAERPLLNLLQRACGIATATRALVDALNGTACRVLHTRKTAPGLRWLDLSAVLAGGGGQHRAGLDASLLFKDNHWRLLPGQGRTLDQVLEAARRRGCAALCVEAESEAQVTQACRAGATRILIDNQDPDTVGRWAALARSLAPGIEIEASGGITLANARRYALAGADFVSVGALTHSVRPVDLALRLD